jgi:phosphinothricin acetyltransferase
MSGIRDATADDAAACAAIYAPYVTDTAITFEYEPPSAEEMARRIAAAQRDHAWLVHEDGGRVAGYAYATRYKERAAYRWAAEVSVYLELGRRRTGAGRALYAVLFDRLVERGFRIAVAGLTLPNEASEGLHRAVGFEPVGVYRRIGWKLDRWHDVARMQKQLTDGDGPPGRLLHR